MRRLMTIMKSEKNLKLIDWAELRVLTGKSSDFVIPNGDASQKDLPQLLKGKTTLTLNGTHVYTCQSGTLLEFDKRWRAFALLDECLAWEGLW